MNSTLGRWLLVTLAIVGLAVAVPAVGAHGDEPTQTNETVATENPNVNNTTDWPPWLEAHMTAHMGPAATEWMESHMGVSSNGSAQEAAGHHWDDDTRDSHWDDDTHDNHWDDDTRVRGTHGQGHGC